jgi:hypothetical protein
MRMEIPAPTRSPGKPPDKQVRIGPPAAANWILSGLCLLLVGCVVGKAIFRNPSAHGGWTEAALVIAATVSTLISLSRSLPLQNVLLAATVIGLFGGFVQALGTLTNIPFGPRFYTAAAGPQFAGILAWWIPLVWIIAVLNSRGAARSILRPWQKARNYGFWLIGLTMVLCLAFDFGLELFGTAIKGYWAWSPGRLALAAQSIPPIHYPIQAISLFATLVIITPLLINKKPVELPPDYHPLFLWTLLNLVFLGGILIR